MSYKTIALHLDMNGKTAARLAFSLRLAKCFDAYLIAIYADFLLPQPSLYTLGEVVDVSGDVVKYRSENAQAVEADFRKNLVEHALTGNWLNIEMDPIRGVAEFSRCADMLVIGQHDPTNDPFYPGYHFAQSMLISSGIPILLVPYAGNFASTFETIVLAWDGSREASRAVHDALPFLRRAKLVVVFTVNAKSDAVLDRRCSGTDVINLLSRHGIIASLRALEGVKGRDIGTILQSSISDLNADLLVMGGYAHSRFHEIIVGGATKTMLQSSGIPVLLSH